MFKKAERTMAYAKIALTGPSGTGKTLSALLIAKGLGGRVAVGDSENGSAALYADHPMLKGFEFDTVQIRPPFATEKYNAIIAEAIKQGYTTVILDSISHPWEGEGGLKDQKDTLDARPNSNHWTNWKPITAKHEKFKSAILQSQINVICTMRSKTEHAQIEVNGKKQIKKLGLAPIQRDGMEYEFTVVLDIAGDHFAETSKDRTAMFSDCEPFMISEETGKKIYDWLKSAKPVEAKVEQPNQASVPAGLPKATGGTGTPPPDVKTQGPSDGPVVVAPLSAAERAMGFDEPPAKPKPPANELIGPEGIEYLRGLIKQHKLTDEDWGTLMVHRTGKQQLKELTNFEANAFKNAIETFNKKAD